MIEHTYGERHKVVVFDELTVLSQPALWTEYLRISPVLPVHVDAVNIRDQYCVLRDIVSGYFHIFHSTMHTTIGSFANKTLIVLYWV